MADEQVTIDRSTFMKLIGNHPSDREREKLLMDTFGQCGSTWRGFRCQRWNGHDKTHHEIANDSHVVYWYEGAIGGGD